MIEVVLNDRLGKKIRVKCKCELCCKLYCTYVLIPQLSGSLHREHLLSGKAR